MEHEVIPPGEIHAPHNWVVADEAARLALVVTEADLGKYCWQRAGESEWFLIGHTPAVWKQHIGPAGADGAPGADGADGAQGPAGVDGASAYEVAVANGFVGTEVEWLDSLVGAQGETGPQGVQGPQGETGPAGADGDAADTAAVIHAATAKATPADADELGLSDSAATWGLKNLTFANLKAWLTGLFVSRSADSTIITPSGQATLTIRGGTDRGNVTLSTGAADGSGVAAGTFGFVHEAATTGSAERRLALVGAATDGATAGHRGGKLSFSTKPNASASLVERMAIDSSGNVGIGGAAPAGVKLYAAGSASQIWEIDSSTGASTAAVIRHKASNRVWVAGVNVADSSGRYVIYDVTAGAERIAVDTSGNVLVTGGGALGYGVGSGGTVTQETSKSTAVTLNKPSGRITMNNASLAAGGTAFFLLNNTAFGLGDLCIAHIYGSSTAGNYEVFAYTNNLNQVGFKVRNISAGALAENVSISFAIIKGATS